MSRDVYGLVLYYTRNIAKGFNIFLMKLGFTFTEVHLIPASTSKVECCHFSSDGKSLATGGHDRKVGLGRLNFSYGLCA